MEYALGTDPLLASATEQLLSVSSTEILGVAYPAMSFPRSNSADGVTFIPQSSNDLLNWSGAIETIAHSAIDPGRDRITVRSLLPITDQPRQFMRLKVETK